MAMAGSPVAALRAVGRSLDRRVAATPAGRDRTVDLMPRVPQVMGGSGHTPRYRPSSACRGRPGSGESTGHTFD